MKTLNRYSISRITYSNFKHIPVETPTSFNFASSVASHSLTILDGPNGYGKTTLFEAIELLLTGEIKSFRGDLKSRGLDDYRLLASDAQHPMVFRVDMKAANGSELHIVRTWTFSSSQASNEITINGVPTSQKELESILSFNKSLFDLGMYISQKESLSFLQNKYKNRGQQVTEILDTSFIDEKLTCLENIKALLTERCDITAQPLEDQCKALNTTQSELKKHIEAVPDDIAQPLYEKLFPDLYLRFDCQDVDVTIPYTAMVEPLEMLKSFSEQYDAYQAECPGPESPTAALAAHHITRHSEKPLRTPVCCLSAQLATHARIWP